MPSTGFIRVQAVTSRAELPVEDAVVTVSSAAADGTRTLLSLQTTDESGLTKEIAVHTPAAENSLSPDQPAYAGLSQAMSHLSGVIESNPTLDALTAAMSSLTQAMNAAQNPGW